MILLTLGILCLVSADYFDMDGDDIIANNSPDLDISINGDFPEDLNADEDPDVLDGYAATFTLAKKSLNVFDKALRYFEITKRPKFVKQMVVVAILIFFLAFAAIISWLTFENGLLLTVKGENLIHRQIFGYALISGAAISTIAAFVGVLYLLIRIFK